MIDNKIFSKILKDQTFPALGCTEPAALAYAGALARERAGGEIKSVKVLVDKNFFKNCLRVTIPKTNLKGLVYAVALGILSGNSAYKLEVLRDINDADIRNAVSLATSGIIAVSICPSDYFYIEVSIETVTGSAKCRIEKDHTRVTMIEQDGQTVFSGDSEIGEADDLINKLSVKSILQFIHQVQVEEIEFLAEGWKMNWDIAQEGIKNRQEYYFGSALKDAYSEGDSLINVVSYAKALTAAACDARMGGLNHSVMAVAGSGNLGIASIVPVVAVSKVNNISREKTLKAIALSQLITIYIKSKIGVLTPSCGCAVAGGVGAGAALSYLMGGNDNEICLTIKTIIGGLAGMICDGAKGGCAMKLAITVGTAFDAVILAKKGITIQDADGIIVDDVEKSINNLSYVTVEGMRCMDDSLIQIMNERLIG
ncbi:MAG: L-serine ammonia-lyase, iron-sulfur-dependent, subunit alpha [Dehalobacterium sp.]